MADLTQQINKNIKLNEHEKLEPLDGEHVIIQRDDMYRFGADAVALAKYAAAEVKRGERVFDLCSGCGAVGIMLAIATGAEVVGAEIDGTLCDMANRSAAANALENVKFINADIRIESGEIYNGARSYDAVVCNPPFFKADSRARSVAAAANCELTVTLTDVIRAAKKLLKPRGALYLVYTATRLDEAIVACTEFGLTPKKLTVNANGKTFLLKCVESGKRGLTVAVSDWSAIGTGDNG